MSGVNELAEAGKWLKKQIEDNTTLSAYLDVIPDDVDLPAVRFTSQFPHDTRTASSAKRILTRIDWIVAVVREGPGMAALISLVNAVDSAIEDQSGSTTAALILACQRQQPFDLLETDRTGAYFRHVGGIYRTTVQQL